MAFIHRLAEAVELEFPKERADSSWDNTGILMEFYESEKESVLLCIDLTDSVLQEALDLGIETVLAYHPPIFTPLKSITQESPILCKCMNNKVSIYSPHTALDGGNNGINNWLGMLIPGAESISTTGYIQTFRNSCTIESILQTLEKELGLNTIRYVLGDGHAEDTVPSVMSIGAGASTRNLKKLILETGKSSDEKPSIVITGEASHHDMLCFQRNGVSMIILEHSRSERGFLQPLAVHLKTALPNAEVHISEKDADPVRFYQKQ
ncbi:uncharacterized protein NESG_00536 [Nematocida ausubeli]|uniref:Uncharacterized protein n=1 Tax=Nematocida ausubeli (strain ATCC PRA-371 / ERTm2) TaxID=1913371 RepID=A0A086J5N9_NEMA1|nr:uncharacterized protein NESG_00536 [Nematocida ausubeli]KFG27457.1 hypothetical protein NESG_00536 [Nematocida ausubeli]